MRTEYEFVLPRGYVDEVGGVHRRGIMRLATARDELEPLRDPTVLGPEDPRLTIVVLSRVVRSLGTVPLVTRHEIEGLFAADLAYLQDFYGVINFGTEEDIQAMLDAQDQSGPPAEPGAGTGPATGAGPMAGAGPVAGTGSVAVEPDEALRAVPKLEARQPSVAERVPGRRGAIEEVSSNRR